MTPLAGHQAAAATPCAEFHDHHFLGWGEGGLQAVWRVRTIGNTVTAFPAADGVLADT